MAIFLIKDLTGGQNSYDPEVSIPENQVTISQNMDYAKGGMLGARRDGMTQVVVSGSYTQAFHVATFVPRAGVPSSELWVMTSDPVFHRKTTAWSLVTAIDATTDATFFDTTSLHDKFFVAYQSAVDRFHVWDGSTLRRTGLAAPGAAPTVADQGGGSYAAIIRYYRVRYTVQSAGVTVRRSEPSAVATFTPSGGGASARVTKPATISEGETHWELEASADNANFYRIATTLVATTTYDDSAAPSSYATTGVLSDASGAHSNIWSARFVTADDDRLLVAGSNVAGSALKNRVGWTPVYAVEGTGNDERITTVPTSFLDLDADEGGEITNFVGPVNNYIYASKISALYRLTRTGNNQNAYQQTTLSKKVGGIYNTMVEGTDEQGAPCVYFWDSSLGPVRYGAQGLQWCGEDIWDLVKESNLAATPSVVAGYDDVNRRVMFAIAVAPTKPTRYVVFACPYGRSTPQGVRGGWSLWTSSTFFGIGSLTMFSDNINDNAARSLTRKMFEGGGYTNGTVIAMHGSGQSDVGSAYRAVQRTRPYQLGDMLRKFEVAGATMLADPLSGGSVTVRCRRDYGLETKDITFALSPVGSETQVLVDRDNFEFSEAQALQFEIGETSGVLGPSWAVNQLAIMVRMLEEAA